MGHGNWKDLFLASGRGDLATVQYHLDQQIDPCFQHPEFFTAPIFEAIRKKQESAVRLLVEHDSFQLTLVEEMSGYTPLQCALHEQKHDMVDVLLTFSDLPQTDRQLVQSILILCNPANALEMKAIERLLECGQRLFVCPSSAHQDLKTLNKTENKKLTVLSIQDSVEGCDTLDFVLVFDGISRHNPLLQKAIKQSKPHFVWVTPLQQMDAHQTMENLGLKNHDYSVVETPSQWNRLLLLDPLLDFIGITTWMETLLQRIVKCFGCEGKDDTAWF